jgi:ABC-type transport system substrate-binding protein
MCQSEAASRRSGKVRRDRHRALVVATPPFPRIAQAVQANLAEAGIRVKLVQRDASSMREAARADKPTWP